MRVIDPRYPVDLSIVLRKYSQLVVEHCGSLLTTLALGPDFSKEESAALREIVESDAGVFWSDLASQSGPLPAHAAHLGQVIADSVEAEIKIAKPARARIPDQELASVLIANLDWSPPRQERPQARRDRRGQGGPQSMEEFRNVGGGRILMSGYVVGPILARKINSPSNALANAALDSLNSGIVPAGVEKLWEYPGVERRFPRLPRPRWMTRECQSQALGARRVLGVRVTGNAQTMVEVEKFRTLRTIHALSGRDRKFVLADVVVFAAVVEGWNSEEIVGDLATLENCGALEYGPVEEA